MNVSFQHRPTAISNQLRGFSVPEAHNDHVAARLPRWEAKAEVKPARWPLVMLALGGLATLAWITFLAWVVVKLVMWLLA